MKIDTLEPRNSRIKDITEIEREQFHKNKKSVKDFNAFLEGEKPEDEEEKQGKKAKSLSDFIEIIIKVGK